MESIARPGCGLAGVVETSTVVNVVERMYLMCIKLFRCQLFHYSSFHYLDYLTLEDLPHAAFCLRPSVMLEKTGLQPRVYITCVGQTSSEDHQSACSMSCPRTLAVYTCMSI